MRCVDPFFEVNNTELIRNRAQGNTVCQNYTVDAELCPVPPGLFEDSNGSHRVG